jgi:hypothetical protein
MFSHQIWDVDSGPYLKNREEQIAQHFLSLTSSASSVSSSHIFDKNSNFFAQKLWLRPIDPWGQGPDLYCSMRNHNKRVVLGFTRAPSQSGWTNFVSARNFFFFSHEIDGNKCYLSKIKFLFLIFMLSLKCLDLELDESAAEFWPWIVLSAEEDLGFLGRPGTIARISRPDSEATRLFTPAIWWSS